MKLQPLVHSFAFLAISIATAVAQTPDNPKVDMAGFLVDAHKADLSRVGRVIDQDKFLAMSTEPNTIILDARSADKYVLRHVKGAVSLPFTDFTAETLANILPDKNTRILIYCNNNFDKAPISMALKCKPASLNLSTLVSLRSYGYTNVYELGGYTDVKQSKIPFAGTEVK